MSNEVDFSESSKSLSGANWVSNLTPSKLEDLIKISEHFYNSKIIPSWHTGPESVLVSIWRGAEIGLPLMGSVYGFWSINGNVCLRSDAMLALAKKSSDYEYMKEYFEGEGENLTAVCVCRRKGEKFDTISTFSVEDAKVAGLMGKDNWKKYPKRMLKIRARSEGLRDTWPHIFFGIYAIEELEDEEIKVIDPKKEPQLKIEEKKSDPVNSLKEKFKQTEELIINQEGKVDGNVE